MRNWTSSILTAAIMAGLFIFQADFAAGQTVQAEQDDLKKTAQWQWPEVRRFEEYLLSYMEDRGVDEDVREQVNAFWTQSVEQIRGPELIGRLISAAALIDPRIDALGEQLLSTTAEPIVPGELPWLTSDTPGWLQDTIRLACGRKFAQRKLYDESLETLAGLSIDQVCDPSSLIFYRAVCEHHLLMKDTCIENVDLLLQREDELPKRYVNVSKLMSADIEPLQEDSLDEVSRLMRDVQRRLELGRLGSKVRGEEQKIVDKLDKMIDKIEKQLQQQKQQQQQQSGEGQQSPAQSQPMEDSNIAGQSGPGDVDNKDVGSRSGWGNLPPAQRQESLQRLTDELPSHYRDVIEGYFRQLAKEPR